MRPERLYLADIVEAADAIGRFLEGISREAFMQDELRQSAVLQKLIVIGEAAARLPRTFTKQHPEIPWPDIVPFATSQCTSILRWIGASCGSRLRRMCLYCASRL